MAGKRGRTAGFKMSQEHRAKIAKSQIVKRLIDFSEGKENVDMKPHQVTAALGLLDRVMPKLAQTDMTSDGEKVEMPQAIIMKAVSANSDD